MSISPAHELAEALDAEDYDRVQAVLHAECVYTCRGETYVGPKEIIGSYAGNGEAAHRFDRISYRSEVELIGDDLARIVFYDDIEHKGRIFTFRSHQDIEFGNGQVRRIQHVDEPGMREALKAFEAELNQ